MIGSSPLAPAQWGIAVLELKRRGMALSVAYQRYLQALVDASLEFGCKQERPWVWDHGSVFESWVVALLPSWLNW